MSVGPNVCLAQCSAAFAAEAKAGGTFHGRQPKVPAGWLKPYLDEEVRHLSDSFGLHAGVQFMDGAGACVNVDDSVVLIGRGLSARIIATMKEKLPPVMKRPEFANRDNVVRAGMRYVLAHEFAHLFQHARANAGDSLPTNEAAFELQADCIAGLWLGYDPSARLLSGSSVIVETQVAAWVFGDEMGDFPTVGVPEKIDATGHSTGVKRMSCVTSGVGAGRSDKFGDRSTAFRDHPKEILAWSAEGAQFYLTPFERQRPKP
jgi:Arc/MetJ-type ribon-helix-helix transcriptional regulator